MHRNASAEPLHVGWLVTDTSTKLHLAQLCSAEAPPRSCEPFLSLIGIWVNGTKLAAVLGANAIHLGPVQTSGLQISSTCARSSSKPHTEQSQIQALKESLRGATSERLQRRPATMAVRGTIAMVVSCLISGLDQSREFHSYLESPARGHAAREEMQENAIQKRSLLGVASKMHPESQHQRAPHGPFTTTGSLQVIAFWAEVDRGRREGFEAEGMLWLAQEELVKLLKAHTQAAWPRTTHWLRDFHLQARTLRRKQLRRGVVKCLCGNRSCIPSCNVVPIRSYASTEAGDI